MSLASPDGTTDDTVAVAGREVTFPVTVRDASSASAAFVVPAGRAQDLLAPEAFEVVEFFPGRTLLSIAAIDYRDNDLGDYNEVSIALFVRMPGTAPRSFARLGALRALARNEVSTYIAWLPVDQEFTREAGAKLWGFPKTVEKIDFETNDKSISCKLTAGDRHVLTLDAFRGGRKELPESTMRTFTVLYGWPHSTEFRSRATGFGARLGGAKITLGDHPFAAKLRALGLPKRPLFTAWMEHMHATFAPAELL